MSSIKKISSVVAFALALVCALMVMPKGAHAATATITGTTIMTGSTSSTVTITESGSALTKFVHSNTTTADATDLAGVTYNSIAATAATTNGTNLVTFTFPITAGTGANSTLAIGANVLTDTVNNGAANILFGGITDNAPPQVVSVVPATTSVGVSNSADLVITFSEPMNTGTFAFSASPSGDTFTPTWSPGNRVVNLSHSVYRHRGDLYTASITVAADVSGGTYSVPGLPYVWTFTPAGTAASANVQTALSPTNPSIAFNAATTTTANVTLTLGATGATEMEISSDPTFLGTTWEPYATSKDWVLTSGDGMKTVYALFRNDRGVSSFATATVTLATAAAVMPVTPPMMPPATVGTDSVTVTTPGGTSVTATHPGTGGGLTVVVLIVRQLSLGKTGDDVTVLQNFLVKNGFLVMPVGVAMGTYGPLTKAAVVKFQLKNKIIMSTGSAGAGRVGPLTLAAVNQQL